MTLTLNAARELFRAGRFVDLVQQAVRANDLPSAQPELRLLLAHALFHTADTAASERIAQLENKSSASLDARAYCEQVLGLLRRRQGAIGRARNHFQTAIQIVMKVETEVNCLGVVLFVQDFGRI